MAIRKSYDVGPITVTKHEVDWSDLEGSVQRRLATAMPFSTAYYNVEYTVEARDGAPLELFVRQARRAQALWNARLARALGSGARKRAVKRADPARRQLLSTGVMFIGGVPQHPKGWPDAQDHGRPRRRRA